MFSEVAEKEEEEEQEEEDVLVVVLGQPDTPTPLPLPAHALPSTLGSSSDVCATLIRLSSNRVAEEDRVLPESSSQTRLVKTNCCAVCTMPP